MPPKCLAYLVVLFFKKQGLKLPTVFRLKLKSLAPPKRKYVSPPKHADCFLNNRDVCWENGRQALKKSQLQRNDHIGRA